MNICLINPPSPWLKNQTAFPPLGLLYLAAKIRNNHPDKIVKIIDYGIALNYYKGMPKSDIIGITASTPQYNIARGIRDRINTEQPRCAVVLGGSHATYAMNGDNDGFNFVFKGDGEYSLNSYINHRFPFIEQNAITQPIDLDVLPKPARDLINLSDYKYYIGRDNLPATTIITSRGCPYSCAFCAKLDNHVRYHSAEYVCAEIDEIIDVHGFNNLLFLDDCFALKRDRLRKICEHTKARNVKFRCYIRPDTPFEVLDMLKDSGCVEVGMGIESGSQEILNIIGKKTTVEQNIKTVKYCESIGLCVNAFLMIGLPEETENTSRQTVEWAKQAKPSKFGYNIYVPYPGSDIYNNINNYPIWIHEMPNEKAITKGDPETIESFVSTPSLSRSQITDLFHKNFASLVKITGWNPSTSKFKGGINVKTKPQV